MAAGVAKVANRLRDAQENGKLDLSDCELTKVPDAVYMMLKETLVESCNLSQNILQSLPRKLCSKFCRIQDLNLSGNKLITLPDELGNLQELQHLDLSCNLLEIIPQAVFHCKRLTHLDIQCNSITDIDLMRLEAMETLETLNIKGNPLPDDVKSQLMDTRLNVIRN